MRLEGRGRRGGPRTQLRKAKIERITPRRRARQTYGRLHLPARLVPRPCDVASASELAVAASQPRRSVTMSTLVFLQSVPIHPTVASVESGVS